MQKAGNGECVKMRVIEVLRERRWKIYSRGGVRHGGLFLGYRRKS